MPHDGAMTAINGVGLMALLMWEFRLRQPLRMSLYLIGEMLSFRNRFIKLLLQSMDETMVTVLMMTSLGALTIIRYTWS